MPYTRSKDGKIKGLWIVAAAVASISIGICCMLITAVVLKRTRRNFSAKSSPRIETKTITREKSKDSERFTEDEKIVDESPATPSRYYIAVYGLKQH